MNQKQKPLSCKLGFHDFVRPVKALYIHGNGINGYVDICTKCGLLIQKGTAIIPKEYLEQATRVKIENLDIQQKHKDFILKKFSDKK
jgi:hypothetical protein